MLSGVSDPSSSSRPVRDFHRWGEAAIQVVNAGKQNTRARWPVQQKSAWPPRYPVCDARRIN
jgi:hypothetical protein